ncbi:MAG: hypothetical protein ABSG53_15795 [Thermoguttaceae bacterium]|jgi:hypothetical protein
MCKQTGILRPLGLALVLVIGFGTVLALAAAWGISIWEGLYRERTYENVVVRADGTPLIQRYTYDGYQNVTYHALDGSDLPGSKENSNENWLGGAFLAMPSRDIIFPLGGNTRVRQFGDGQTPLNLWYFIHDGARDGRGYFVGYNSQSKLRVGFIGRDGLRPDQPPVEQWFPMDGVKLASGRAFSRYAALGYLYGDGGDSSGEFPARKTDMISGTQLLQVDLRTGSVTMLMESPDLMAASILATVSTSQAAGDDLPRANRHRYLAVRTTDRVLVLDVAGKQHTAYVLPEELRERSIILYELDEGTALITSSRLLPDRRSLEELLWIDASGKVLRRAEVFLGKGNARYEENEAWRSALVVPVPLALAFVTMLGPPVDHLRNGLAPNYATALAQVLAACWPAFLVVTLLAAALAWYCWCRHHRYCQPSSVVWFVFVLLLGLPGLVGYLFHRRWPVLEKCPACGHVVPRDREACAQCGAVFPPPQPKGCEVFA